MGLAKSMTKGRRKKVLEREGPEMNVREWAGAAGVKDAWGRVMVLA